VESKAALRPLIYRFSISDPKRITEPVMVGERTASITRSS
jgi:hypothetical protein